MLAFSILMDCGAIIAWVAAGVTIGKEYMVCKHTADSIYPILLGVLLTALSPIAMYRFATIKARDSRQVPGIKVAPESALCVSFEVEEKRVETITYDFSAGRLIHIGNKSYIVLKMWEDPLKPEGAKVINDLFAALEQERSLKKIIDFEFDGLRYEDKPYVEGIWVTWGIPLESETRITVPAREIALESE